MAKITGAGRHTRRLKNMRRSAKEIVAALDAAGQDIEKDAEVSITTQNKTGALYTHEFVTINGRAVPIRERKSPHRASAPGEAPAADTRFLDSNIETSVVAQNPPTVHVTSHAPYSAMLEFGTSKIDERPFMRPATEKNRRKVGEKVAAAVRTTVRRG